MQRCFFKVDSASRGESLRWGSWISIVRTQGVGEPDVQEV